MKFSNLATATTEVLLDINQKDKIPTQIIEDISLKNKFVTIFGNGGSAADAQHFATELICSYRKKERKPFKALALTADSSLITAWSNDFNFEGIFSRQIEAMNSSIGTALGLSTSGNSVNVINGLQKAKELGLSLIHI